jgi:hypothetical protein
MRKFEEWKQTEQKKRTEADESFTKRERVYQKVRKDQRKQNLLRMIETRLRQDERDANARHQENLKARQAQVLREKQKNNDTRIQKFKDEQAKLQLTRIQAISKLADERAKFDADFRATMHKPDNSEKTIKKLAKKFNMDLEELTKKVQKRPATAAVIRPQTRQSKGSPKSEEKETGK